MTTTEPITTATPPRHHRCPRCRATNVLSIAHDPTDRDKHRCGACGSTLRLVMGSNGPTFVPWITLPWEKKSR